MMTQRTEKPRRQLHYGAELSQKSAMHYYKIGSHVFMKCHVSDTSKPKITEIAMISLTEHDLTHGGSGDADNDLLKSRYKDILVLSFDPDEEVHAQDSVNSDLNLDMLKNSKKMPFSKKSVKLIDGFLRTQCNPVCLISHSGNYLDFRFLKTAVNSFGMNLLGGNLLCADTIDMFAKLDSDINSACLLDTRRYSLDNVYRRCFGELPTNSRYDAKSLVMRLIKIYQKELHNPVDPPRTRYFSSVGTPISKPALSSSQYSPHLASPLKKIVLDSQDSDCCGNLYPPVASQLPADIRQESSIETFVFFDLETTGLDTDTDNITEICAYAVNVHDLQYVKATGHEISLKDIVPRLANQLNMMVLPISEIPEKASEISRIAREELALRKKECFTINTAHILENFLSQLKEPICVVAHNGFQFDFPMLHTHLRRTKTVHPIWNRIFCSDTLPVLRAKFPDQSHRLNNVFNNLAGQVKGKICQLHSAEGDVLRLLVITRLQEHMIEWLENEKLRFDGILKYGTNGQSATSSQA